ncbi:MAG: acyltransferase [Pseudomonadota bacterium]|nr:acyltransferase [Pseudomonadota bacterium]
MTVFRRIWGRLLRWHERSVGQIALYGATGLSWGKNVRAKYGLRIRAVDGGSIEIGSNTSLDRWVDLFAHKGHLRLGANCHVGKGCTIVAREMITIGDGCQIAENVTIRDQDHRIQACKSIMESGYVTSPITIEDHVWIGAGAVITRGVSIGERSIIGAGAVVTRDIPPHARVGGIPARPLPHRNKE